jgi:copper chaperone CopZ
MSTTQFTVAGMTCEHCVKAVTAEVSAIPGVSDVRIDLVPGEASLVTVDSTGPLADSDLVAAVDEAGYELVRP